MSVDASRLANPGRRDPASYYDEFSAGYDHGRDHGYHALVDDLEIETLAPYLAPETRALEAGCGTGLILQRVDGRLKALGGRAVGVDLSHGMLARAEARGLEVVRGSLTTLPFPDASFDLVYSFKVLAHVPQAGQALAELARVTRPGGVVVAEYYNTRSLRYVIKRLRPARRISKNETDSAVYTRYDSLSAIRSYLPPGLQIRSLHGVRVFTALPSLLKVPVVGAALDRLERQAAHHPRLARYGGFLVVVLERR
jgi:ubiquinone/menaquinone biosynthesis C-methylase UbiE